MMKHPRLREALQPHKVQVATCRHSRREGRGPAGTYFN
jgi:hypothetical protein